MKILVLCLPRTGSTSFVNALKKTLGLNLINIPDAYKFPENKALIDHVLSKESVILRMTPSHNVGMDLVTFSKHFDYTFFLSRKNLDDYYKRFVNLYYKEIIVGSGWFNPYDYNDIPVKYQEELKNSSDWNRIMRDREDLHRIGQDEIIFYEDLFYSNEGTYFIKSKLEEIDINKFKEYLTEFPKLRKKFNKRLI